jgi:hypothetical protein
MRNLELASYVCGDTFGQKVTMSHPPLINDVDLFEFMLKNGLDRRFQNEWQGSWTDKYYSIFLLEDGICMTFNQISADLIFRNETVDPKFLQQFRSGASKMKPQSWSIETGYIPDGTHFFPLKSLNNGAESGFAAIIININKEIDRHCRHNPEYIKIALHHPAEVALKANFIKMPFNKSVSMMVKPKITKTSDSLKSYDPEV